MKRPSTIAIGATWAVGTAAAFSPSSTAFSSLTARSQLHADADARRGVSYRSRFSSFTSQRTPGQCSLGSTLQETFETEAANNETLQTAHDFLVDAAATPLVSGATISGDSGISDGTSKSIQQQLEQVLSSPELLDPAAILDATIGINDENPEVTVDSLAGDEPTVTIVSVTATPLTAGAATIFDDSEAEIVEQSVVIGGKEPAVDDSDIVSSLPEIPPASTIEEVAAESKEEDLELTLQAILNHMEQISVGSDVVKEDVDVEQALIEPAAINDHEGSVLELLSIDETDGLEIGENDHQISEQSKAKASILDNTPSISKILKYTIPAIGIWLCSPVLSMIDTAAVGLLSGTAQQAALNPAVSVTDMGSLVVAFMYTATTNLIAAAVQKDKDNIMDAGKPKTTTTLLTSLKLALLVGSMFGVVLGTSSKHLLKLLIGNDALDPAVFSAALRYTRIRCLGMPAMVVMGTAQSACLGMQDVKSPLYVLMAAAVINFFGDVLLVPMAGSKMFGGAAGAAWATVASQYAALLFFANWLTTNPSSNGKKRLNLFSWMKRKSDGRSTNDNDDGTADAVDITQGIMELTGTSKAGRSRRKEFREFLGSSKLSRRVHLSSKYEALHPELSTDTTNNTDIIRPIVQEKKKREVPITRGFLSDGKLTLRKYFSFSKSNFNTSKAKEFLPFVVPVTTTSVGRISGYLAMSHVASSTLGTYDMAGHQIVFSIFCCLAPFVDALSQVAQSFVPAIFEAKEKNLDRAMALRKTINNFRIVGMCFGVMLVGAVANIPLISRWFTTDPFVLESVNGALPGVGLFMLMNGLMCAGEGTLLGQKDLKFLRNMYAIFFFTVPAYMLRLKRRSLAGVQTVGIGTMWAAFGTYNVIRVAIWHLRLAQLQRRTDRGVVSGEAEGGDERIAGKK